MARVWTHGTWTVEPGRAQVFVAALGEMARAAESEVGAPLPTLLRDRERPNVFLTFGPWESDADIERFREFLFPRLGPVRELLESFEPLTLDEVELP
jgi:quinol monooxygenase YgiN